MKPLRVIVPIGLVLAGLGAALVITNPPQPTYESYATQRLVVYLRENVCTPQLQILGSSLQKDCQRLLVQNQTDIQQLLSKGTQRQNFGILSLYKTDLSVNTVFPFMPPSVLPAYHFETIGIFQTFYTYKTEQR